MNTELGPGIFEFLSSASLQVGDRIYPLTLPQNVVLPAVTFRLISEVAELTHDSQQDHPLYNGHRFEDARVQFDTYGVTFDEAEAASNELKAAITGYRGLWGAVQIESVQPAGGLDDYDPQTGKFRRITDYFISWIGGVATS